MPISSLCQGTALTDKCNSRNGAQVCRITPHQMIAHWTAEFAATWFRDNGIENSVNYCIGYDGSIWCNVDEAYRAWTSSSWQNDQIAITIELSNNENIYSGQMTDATINAFIDLCVDLIKRYPGLGGKFNYTGNLSGNISLHEWFAATNCPGQWFKDKLPWIQQQVNAKLNNGYTTPWDVVNDYIKGKDKKTVDKLFKTVFDAKFYSDSYADLKKAFGTDSKALFNHFLTYGMGEGRRAAEKFDPVFYKKNYPDLAQTFKGSWPHYYVHYMKYGKKEHRVAYDYNFTDNMDKSTSWYKPIRWAYKNGLIRPTTSGRYGIDSKTTRKALALMLWRRAGRPSGGNNPYKDINLEAASWCYKKGYIKGRNGKFNGNAGLSNATVLLILWRASGKPPAKGDTNKEKAIAWAKANKIQGGKLDPEAACPKKHMIRWFYKTFK